MVHFPTITTLYIDAWGTEETRTVMRAELVAIHKTLDKFPTHECVGIFTDSLSSLQAIRYHYTHQGPSSHQNYHHHYLLMSGITDLPKERRRRVFRTTLHKIRAHINVRDNIRADAAAKMAVTQYNSLPESQKSKIDVGEVPSCPPLQVMYTVRPPPPPTYLGADTRMATLRQPC